MPGGAGWWERIGRECLVVSVVKIVVQGSAGYTGIFWHDDLHDRSPSALSGTTIITTADFGMFSHDDLHDLGVGRLRGAWGCWQGRLAGADRGESGVNAWWCWS